MTPGGGLSFRATQPDEPTSALLLDQCAQGFLQGGAAILQAGKVLRARNPISEGSQINRHPGARFRIQRGITNCALKDPLDIRWRDSFVPGNKR